ncbi:MAG: hypothetical protein JJT89_09785 [Nitriliruptoraceae bacterium]|nr:hypothetical protein [Nitriliruptoraceae bacterium]
MRRALTTSVALAAVLLLPLSASAQEATAQLAFLTGFVAPDSFELTYELHENPDRVPPPSGGGIAAVDAYVADFPLLFDATPPATSRSPIDFPAGDTQFVARIFENTLTAIDDVTVPSGPAIAVLHQSENPLTDLGEGNLGARVTVYAEDQRPTACGEARIVIRNTAPESALGVEVDGAPLDDALAFAAETSIEVPAGETTVLLEFPEEPNDTVTDTLELDLDVDAGQLVTVYAVGGVDPENLSQIIAASIVEERTVGAEACPTENGDGEPSPTPGDDVGDLDDDEEPVATAPTGTEATTSDTMPVPTRVDAGTGGQRDAGSGPVLVLLGLTALCGVAATHQLARRHHRRTVA